MEKKIPKTVMGEWTEGVLKLLNAGFDKEDVIELNFQIASVIRSLLEYYDSEDVNVIQYTKNSVEELMDSMIKLKNAGYSMSEITEYLDDVKMGYSIYEDEDDLNNQFLKNFGYDDDDDDDEDDDDEDDDNFNPRKFFPGK